MKRNLFITLAIISIAFPVSASETRCGWLANSPPGGMLLFDKDGKWYMTTLYTQKMSNLPESDRSEYVIVSNRRGYSCACLEVKTDSNQMRIISIESSEALKLSVCREDPNLPETPPGYEH